MKRALILSTLVVIVALLNINNVFAEKIILQSGTLSILKSQKNIRVQFDYSNMTVGKKLTEEEYVNKKISQRNEKSPGSGGSGENWRSGWINARKDRYQPKFIELFNKQTNKQSLTISENGDSQYTLIVKTVYTEPGFNVGVLRERARVNFVFLLVETLNPTKVIAELSADAIPGGQAMGYDFDSSSRIAESYAKGGKMLGQFIIDEIK